MNIFRKIIITLVICVLTGSFINAQSGKGATDSTNVRGPQKSENQVKDQGDNKAVQKPSGNPDSRHPDGKSAGTEIKQVKGARPDMTRAKGARPQSLERPAGSRVPKGVGRPGGAVRPGGR